MIGLLPLERQHMTREIQSILRRQSRLQLEKLFLQLRPIAKKDEVQ